MLFDLENWDDFCLKPDDILLKVGDLDCLMFVFFLSVYIFENGERNMLGDDLLSGDLNLLLVEGTLLKTPMSISSVVIP